MSSKQRVYEVARDLNLDAKVLVDLLHSMGVSEVKNHMSVVSQQAIDRVKKHMAKPATEMVEETRISATVVKRRAVKKPTDAEGEGHGHEQVEAAPSAVVEPPAPPRSSPVAAPKSSPVAAPAPKSSPVAAPKSSPVAAPAPGVAKPVEEPAVAQVAPAPAAEAPAPAPAPTPSAPVEKTESVAAVAKAVEEPEAKQPAPAPSAPVEKPAAEAKPVEAAPDSVFPAVQPAAPQPAAVPPTESMPVAAKPVEAAPAVAPSPAAQPAAAPLTESKPAAVASAEPAPAAAASPARPSVAPEAPARPSQPPPRPSQAPKTGVEVWGGRPGVPMPQPPRGPMPRRVQYDAKAGGPGGPRRPGPGQGRGPGGPGGRRGFGPGGVGGPARVRTVGGAPVTQERSAHKKIVRIEGSIGLQMLGAKMGIKAHELLRKLVMLGMTGVNINTTLDADTAKIVASEFGWEVEDVEVSEAQALVAAQGLVSAAEDDGSLLPRPPVVTVMGHVDHGKTSLLDRIRKANVVAGEAGGITQHVGAYNVSTPRGNITFLDTPGHEAFTAMRARGAQCTDLVVLVVAADDGVMPQTREAVVHAKNARVPIVVAVNKIDKPDAQPERVRRELSELALVPEEWGGDTLFCEVSALTGAGVENLLEQILLQAEMLELRANPNKLAAGVVIEAELDRGRGPVATLLVTEGTLSRGDVILAGGAWGKIRAMLDHAGNQVKKAGPSTPVAIIGLNDVPSAGDPVHVVTDLKKAQEIAEGRKSKERRALIGTGGPRMTLEDLARAMNQAEQLELKLIIKADVQGSVEAVEESLSRLTTEKVKVTIVHAAVGGITEGDVNLAAAAGAIIIGFNARPAGKAASLAQQERIEIRQYSIIYNLLEDVKSAMEGLLAPTMVEKMLGTAEVRQVFKISKAGSVAGCMVTSGLVKRAGEVRLKREGELIWSGKMSSLKRFKDDAREVKEGFDCGIALDGYQDMQVGDIIESFELEEVKQKL